MTNNYVGTNFSKSWHCLPCVTIYKIFQEELIIMSKQQLIEDLISRTPENKLDIILAFIKFVLYENDEINNSFLSEPSLAKDWMRMEEDAAWQNL
jgi:hypothetical protein